MVLSRMKTDGGRETCPAGILRADRVDVSFPIGMHWWEGRLFEEAFLNSNALTNPKYVLDLQRIRFSRKQRLEEGVLLESSGPLTVSQLAIAGAAALYARKEVAHA